MSHKKDAHNPIWLLLVASLKVKQELVRIVEKHDLNVMQAYTVLLLPRDEAVPMHTISNILSCDPSNVTGIVDRLERDGYLARIDHPNDRRIKQICMTEAGNTLRDTMLELLSVQTKPLFSQLADQETSSLANLLGKMLAAESK